MSRVRGPADDRGAATLMVVACAGLLMVVGCALGVVASIVAAHRTAQSAADLAALAGAAAAGHGEDACGAAADQAVANGTTLVACATVGREVTVEVVARGPTFAGWHGDPAARSRAGPA